VVNQGLTNLKRINPTKEKPNNTTKLNLDQNNHTSYNLTSAERLEDSRDWKGDLDPKERNHTSYNLTSAERLEDSRDCNYSQHLFRYLRDHFSITLPKDPVLFLTSHLLPSYKGIKLLL
jgi:hypothetical protein